MKEFEWHLNIIFSRLDLFQYDIAMNTTPPAHYHKHQNKKSSFDESSTIDSRCSADPFDYRTKFKMEICKAWRDYGLCLYGDQCAFAHGQHQLRDRALIATTKYKTKLCINFFEKGYCSYGKRCQFSHCIPKKGKPIVHFERKLSFVSEVERLETGDLDLSDLAAHTEEARPTILRKLANGIPASE